jgi:hypothetical protein
MLIDSTSANLLGEAELVTAPRAATSIAISHPANEQSFLQSFQPVIITKFSWIHKDRIRISSPDIDGYEILAVAGGFGISSALTPFVAENAFAKTVG